MPWTFYPAFLGTILSIFGWSYLLSRKHNRTDPKTLSELSAEEDMLWYGRAVLWVCGILFGITTFFFIVPRIDLQLFVLLAGFGMVFFELLTGVFPANKRWVKLHDAIAYIMAFSMAMLALLFALALKNSYSVIEIMIVVSMIALGVLSLFDKKRLIYYEVPFVWLSHGSVLIAALALR